MIVHGFTEDWGLPREKTSAPGERNAYPVVRLPLNRGLDVGKTQGIRGHEAVRAFVQAGVVVRQGKDDHVNTKMPSGIIITLPWSKVLKIGLLMAAIKKAGLTKEEFLELL